MKHHKFTEEQRAELELNPNVERVLNSNVRYVESFKAYALKEWEGGKSSHLIFKEAQVPDWLNRESYAKSALQRWRDRKMGKPRFKEKPIDEMSIEELRARLRYKEIEIDFLKKIRAL